VTDLNAPYRLAVIVGSTREGRFGHNIAAWFAGQASQRDDVDVDVVDLDDHDIHSRFGPAGRAALAGFNERLDGADAFVVVTPEYNHSYPAALKQAIDFAKTEWQAKPVGFVSYGGVSGGLRAVEHLRGVFAELHAMTLRDTVSLHNYPQLFDADGTLIDPELVNVAAKKLLDSLAWWALALRKARYEHPYTA
jgi:NAD(P)H-dependent FMN reductase